MARVEPAVVTLTSGLARRLRYHAGFRSSPPKEATSTRRLANQTALAILAAYGLTTVHHIYGGLVDEAPNRLRVPFIMAIPSLVALEALRRYKRTGSGAALATSSAVAVLAWVVLSGLLHGGYAHAYKDILFLADGPPELYYPLNPDEHYPPTISFLR